jgi:hypothetical protein
MGLSGRVRRCGLLQKRWSDHLMGTNGGAWCTSLVGRCQGWTDDMVRQHGWAPEVG